MGSRMTKEQLETTARAAGFDAVGVTRAGAAPHEEAFLEWLSLGMHASMDWLERDPGRRSRPDLLLPGARSVIALAVNYFVSPEPEDGEETRGVIARYARGRDYHNWIPKRLRTVDRALAAAGGVQRCFVDSGPLLERDFAVMAGIGWHGKSTMVLHPKLGTWFFLAAILTTLEIGENGPLRDRCGSCTRCIDACPTAAIVAPYRLDARRCISYWTIEHEGPLPEWIRPLIGSRIFGCDDCLDACPWNRFAVASREASVAVRPSSHWPLRDYLTLDDEAFRRLFEGSPVRRAGRQGFLRNVCTALGNAGDERDLPALRVANADPDSIISEHAGWAIGRITGRQGPGRC